MPEEASAPQVPPPRLIANPSHPGHGIILGALRFVHTWSCLRCNTAFGRESDEERMKSPPCPFCGQATDKVSTFDRRPDA
jgi:rubrerythrin